jgi:lipoprotein-anchoring transpeptidase ErfK/SrfK
MPIRPHRTILLPASVTRSSDAHRAIEPERRPEQNGVMTRLGRKRGIRGFVAWLGVAVLCTFPVHAPAQVGSPLNGFRPTMEDVAPGVDHGNNDDNLPDEFQRQAVFYRSQQPPGTIIIDTQERHLYLIESETRAMRYGIGVGRDGFTWQGLLQITRKSEWPDWRPPPEMIDRQPYLPRFMAGGPGNPLGARAMYLGNTVYRIHGTNAPETIGQAVSSGCFRLVNDDVIDLYDRVPVGTKVIVRQD